MIARMSPGEYRPLVEAALQEDLRDEGDVTSAAMFNREESKAVLFSKDSGILAGSDVFASVFASVDAGTHVQFFFADSDRLEPGDRVAEVRGKITAILSGERIALNFLSHLSGIASETRRFVDAASSSGKAVILDTRKTLPGFRGLAKYAVTCGGGRNHRMGLFDMVLIKDNHIDFAGSVTEAVDRVRGRWQDRFEIEVECRTLDEVSEALSCRVNIIMLDNMSVSDMRAAVSMRDSSTENKPQLEASGNITLSNIAEISGAGVDLISSGSLTHSVTSFDFSLKTDSSL